MRKRRFGRHFSRQTLLRASALAVLGLGLAGAVVHAFAPASFGPGSPLTRPMRGEDPTHLFSRLNNQLLNSPTMPAEADYAAVGKAATQVPLSAEPFFLFGFRALSDGDRVRGTRLIEEARRRNPRHRLARLLWLDHLLTTNRTAEATVELAAIRRLVPEATDMIVDQLARLAVDPRSAGAVAKTLRSEPLLDDVLERLARNGADVGQILTLAASGRRESEGSPSAPWKIVILTRLVDAGQYQRAHALWRQFGRVGTAQATVYNPQFAEVAGGPPFNWQLATGAIGGVEPLRGGGLSIDYYGRESGDIATQLLLLQPGRYRLQFNAEGNAPGQGTVLQWRLTCAKAGGAVLVDAPLKGISYKPQTVRQVFDVPGDCPAQWLRLQGVSGEFPTPQIAQISQFSLQRVGP